MSDAKSLAAAVRRGEIPLPPGYLEWAVRFARDNPQYAKTPDQVLESWARDLFADMVAKGYLVWKPKP
jgi:hypothetical protein